MSLVPGLLVQLPADVPEKQKMAKIQGLCLPGDRVLDSWLWAVPLQVVDVRFLSVSTCLSFKLNRYTTLKNSVKSILC